MLSASLNKTFPSLLFVVVVAEYFVLDFHVECHLLQYLHFKLIDWLGLYAASAILQLFAVNIL